MRASKNTSNRKLKRIVRLAAFLVAMAVLSASNALAATVATPSLATDTDGYYLINTAADLDLIRDFPAAKFRLNADISLTGFISKNVTATKGWEPVSKDFTGALDGNGFAISGLWSRPGGSGNGLFSTLKGATVKDLDINLDSRGITATNTVGALAGTIKGGSVVENVGVYGGSVAATSGSYAGGLVGQATGKPADTIVNCGVYDTRVESSSNYAGGLVGLLDNEASVSFCEAIGTPVNGNSYVGGFAGAAKGTARIERCYANGSVNARDSYGGGFVGVIYDGAIVNNCCAEGDVQVKNSYAGGFTAYAYGGSAVLDAYAFGNVSSNRYAGGFAGRLNNSVLLKVCAYGNVTTKSYIAGGLVGEAETSVISNTYAQGNVTGTTGVGGLVGYFSGSGQSQNKAVMNSYSSGRAIGTGYTEYGAFNGRSGVWYLGTNYFDSTKAVALLIIGSSGSPYGDLTSYPKPRKTDEMMKMATFVDWDFFAIWRIDEGRSYPYFWLDYSGRNASGIAITPVVEEDGLKIRTDFTSANHTLGYTIIYTPTDITRTTSTFRYTDASGVPLDASELASTGRFISLFGVNTYSETIPHDMLVDALRAHGGILYAELVVNGTRPDGRAVTGITKVPILLVEVEVEAVAGAGTGTAAAPETAAPATAALDLDAAKAMVDLDPSAADAEMEPGEGIIA